MAVIVVPVLCVTSTGSEDIWSCSVSASLDPTLLSVLHCLPPAGHVEPVTTCSMQVCVATTVSYTTQRRKCCLPPVPRYTRHDLLSLKTAATPPSFPPPPPPQLIARLSHLGIARNVPRKPRRSRRGGENERRKIKVIVGFRDRLPSDSSSCPTPCRQPAELDFYHFSSALLPHPDERQHTTSVPPSSPPSDRDDLSASSLSAPLRPPHRQLLHIPRSFSLAENTLFVCFFRGPTPS